MHYFFDNENAKKVSGNGGLKIERIPAAAKLAPIEESSRDPKAGREKVRVGMVGFSV